jgi:hypothetical protein
MNTNSSAQDVFFGGLVRDTAKDLRAMKSDDRTSFSRLLWEAINRGPDYTLPADFPSVVPSSTVVEAARAGYMSAMTAIVAALNGHFERLQEDLEIEKKVSVGYSVPKRPSCTTLSEEN